MATSCDTCVIRNSAVCAALSPEQLALLNRLGRRRHLRRGEALMHESDDEFFCANLISGMMKMSDHLDDGREQIIGIAYPADFIGQPFGTMASHDVVALTDAELCVFPRRSFAGFSREHPDLAHRLLERTFAELDRARKWMLLLGRKTARERVASLLVEMSQRLLPAGCATDFPALRSFRIPLSRQQMADVLGLTIETVSRQFSQLRSEGLIRLDGLRDIEILSPAALAEAAG